MPADGPATVTAGQAEAAAGIEPRVVAHLRTGTRAITLSAAGLSRFFVIGGIPFSDRLITWWNFAARTADEIAAARDSWMTADGRFGEVPGYHGDPLPAPPLPADTLIPR